MHVPLCWINDRNYAVVRERMVCPVNRIVSNRSDHITSLRTSLVSKEHSHELAMKKAAQSVLSSDSRRSL